MPSLPLAQKLLREDVDSIAAWPERLVSFEVKYRDGPVGLAQLKGLRQFCAERDVPQGNVITKNVEDFGLLPLSDRGTALRIPAPLACYWLGRSEAEGDADEM